MCGLMLPFGSLPAGCAVGPGVDAEAGADPGTTISGLSDTGVSPWRRFQPLILGLAVAIWALTHFTGHDSRDPSGLTLAHQPGHSSASVCNLRGRTLSPPYWLPRAGLAGNRCARSGEIAGRCALIERIGQLTSVLTWFTRADIVRIFFRGLRGIHAQLPPPYELLRRPRYH